jgi:hypothetical protein
MRIVMYSPSVSPFIGLNILLIFGLLDRQQQ